MRMLGITRIAFVVAMISFAGRAWTQTTRPADDIDQSTQSLLKDLGAPASATTAPTTMPSEVSNAPSSPGFDVDDDASQTSLRSLVSMFRYVLLTAAALGIAASIVGLFVLLRREALVALAIPQVVAIGAAIGMRLGYHNDDWQTLVPAVLVAMIAMLYFAMSRRWGASNWIMPAFYVAGACLSFLIIANHGQDVDDLKRIFAGVDIAVTGRQAAIAVPILLLTGFICALLWRRWLLMAQAPAAAELAGHRPARWDTLFLFLLTIIILLGTDTLGVTLVLAMLFLPAATVLPWVKRLPTAMVAGAILSLIFLAVGFYLSSRMSWPMSQSIGGAGFAALAISQLAAQLRS
jgi:ABC-type Mn2+/Zn2+ transport system permease subunit